MQVPTMVVIQGGREVRINKEDFNPKIHTLPGKKVEPPAEDVAPVADEAEVEQPASKEPEKAKRGRPRKGQ